MKFKLKSNKSATKRFRVNGAGRIKFKRSKMRHRQRRKEKSVKRYLRKPGYFKQAEEKMARNLLAYN